LFCDKEQNTTIRSHMFLITKNNANDSELDGSISLIYLYLIARCVECATVALKILKSRKVFNLISNNE
jgi:hypothetical protein